MRICTRQLSTFGEGDDPDESLVKIVAGCPTLLEETALYLLENWKSEGLYFALLENRKLLETSPAVVVKLAESVETILR